MIKNWNIKPVISYEIVDDLASKLNINNTLSKLLHLRGIETYEDSKLFFRPEISNLHDPFLMLNMDKAVNRLIKAVENKEKILVFGDYDVDGTTSVATVYSFLKNDMQMDVDYYIPDRYKEGYGISLDAIDYAEQNNQSLIIALDCGIRAIKQIEYAKEKSIDFIICDHHQPGESIPDAAAVLDPVQSDCNYPFKGLSGCGVGFKLLQGFCEKYDIDDSLIFQYLDLLTISIGADIVSLSGENRIFAHFGLKILSEEPRLGIKTMLGLAEFTKPELTITNVVFTLAPRINAAGRISSGKDAVRLLISTDLEEAKEIGEKIENNNKHRRELDKGITEEALQKIEEEDWFKDAWSTVMYGENWHKGVIGIVASRLIEKYYRPTIVLTVHEGMLVGSARSIKGFDIHKAMQKCDDLLDKYGGHPMAAGMSMKMENFKEFQTRIDNIVRESLTKEDMIPEIEVDSELNFDEITPKFYRILKQFGPFGPDNLNPVFITKNVYNDRFTKSVGSDKTHLKLHVKQKGVESFAMDGIGFSLGKFAKGFQAQKLFDIVYSLEENIWKDRITIQLMVKDIRPVE